MTPVTLTSDEADVLLKARTKYNDQQHAFTAWQDAKSAGNHTHEYIYSLKQMWIVTKQMYDAYVQEQKPTLKVVLLEKHHKIAQ